MKESELRMHLNKEASKHYQEKTNILYCREIIFYDADCLFIVRELLLRNGILTAVFCSQV